MADQVELLRPLTIGGKRYEKGTKVDVSLFDGPGTVEHLKKTGALKDAGKKEV